MSSWNFAWFAGHPLGRAVLRPGVLLLVVAALGRAELPLVEATYSPAPGIGPQEGVMRRDPSDVIQADGVYHIWYSKGKFPHGYDASIWYATSPDGHAWTEQGEALPRGEAGAWDEQSVFTPNILVAEGKYWLFYTAVPKPFVASGPGLTRTAIGVASADSPSGPWRRFDGNPVLRPRGDESHFDGVRVDDACLIVRDGRYLLYYKGRQGIKTTPHETQMGLAIATRPQGPYTRVQEGPVLRGGHEVLVWPHGPGVAALVSAHGPEEISRRIHYAADGIHFAPTHRILPTPSGAGAFRPDAFTNSGQGRPIEWGIHIRHQAGALPSLERFDLRWPTPGETND
jgi:hypothetical protein